ncbi:MAG: hypothetical protein ABSC41_05160 [Acidimicrobiales bacterium]
MVEPEHKRIVDHLDPRLVNVLTVLGFGVPVAAYFWFVGTYSVNVPTNDQWTDIPVIQDTWSHLDWSALWLPHNENRVFFPNIIVVVLAHTVHFNIRVEELLSAVMLTAATAMLIWAHKRRSPSTPWLYYCPVAILALSFVQSGNALWGFQLAWYLVLLSLAACIVFLDRLSLGRLACAAAVAAAVVGSFSSVQGLLIWPIGLILLYHRRRPWSYAIAWIICAVATVLLYYHHFTNKAGGRQPAFALHHPLTAIHYLLFLVGDIVGLMRDAAHPGSSAVVLFGLVVVVLAVITVLVYGIRRDPSDGGPVGISLICFGLGFAVIVTQGRAFLGTVEASGSRYTTFDLLILIGVYLTLLQPPLLGSNTAPPRPQGGDEMAPNLYPRLAGWMRRSGFKWAQAVVVCAIVLQVAIGVPNGLQNARLQHANQVHAAYVLRTIGHRKNTEIARYLDAFDNNVYIRAQARTAKRLRLSLFATLPPRTTPGHR